MEPVARTDAARAKRKRPEVKKPHPKLRNKPIEVSTLSHVRGGQLKKVTHVAWECPNGCGLQKRYRNQCDKCLHPRVRT